jgi:hypothetical protein
MSAFADSLGPTTHEFRWARLITRMKLVDGRAKHDHDEEENPGSWTPAAGRANVAAAVR